MDVRDTTSDRTLALVQNLVSTLTLSNKPIFDELDKQSDAFKKFMDSATEQFEANTKKTAFLEAELTKVKAEKQQIIDAHEREKVANKMTTESIQRQFSELAQTIQKQQKQIASLSSTVTALQHKHANHVHAYSWGHHQANTDGPSQ